MARIRRFDFPEDRDLVVKLLSSFEYGYSSKVIAHLRAPLHMVQSGQVEKDLRITISGFKYSSLDVKYSRPCKGGKAVITETLIEGKSAELLHFDDISLNRDSYHLFFDTIISLVQSGYWLLLWFEGAGYGYGPDRHYVGCCVEFGIKSFGRESKDKKPHVKVEWSNGFNQNARRIILTCQKLGGQSPYKAKQAVKA